jgi:hypothetical protein
VPFELPMVSAFSTWVVVNSRLKVDPSVAVEARSAEFVGRPRSGARRAWRSGRGALVVGRWRTEGFVAEAVAVALRERSSAWCTSRSIIATTVVSTPKISPRAERAWPR